MSGIALVAGLANPGQGYATTRHNAGSWFLDYLSGRYLLQFREDCFVHSLRIIDNTSRCATSCEARPSARGIPATSLLVLILVLDPYPHAYHHHSRVADFRAP